MEGYDLDQALSQKDTVWTWDFRYLESTSFIFPEEIDLRAQRFDSDMNSLWNENEEQKGKIIVDADNTQHKAKVTTFNDNRVVIVWRDLRNDPDGDVYVQILDVQGENVLNANGIAKYAIGFGFRMRFPGDKRGVLLGGY